MSCKSWWRRGDDNLTGTSGPDWLFGGQGDNKIDGGAGNDFLWAGNGNNIVDGGAGNDFVWAGRGIDLIDGGAGNDFIRSGRGDDVVNGGDGHDWIRSGRGHDVVNGGAGNDWINSGGGDDVVNGGEGSDWIRGGWGEDILSGGAGDDYIRGGRGDDILSGGAGNDRLYGGSGKDKFFYSVTENTGSKDYYHGGRGHDVLVLQMTHAEFTAQVQAEIESFKNLLAQPGYWWKYKTFEFESLGLKVKSFEYLEVQLTDSPPASRTVAPTAVDDVVTLETDVVPIQEVESNDPNGLPLDAAAQVIERSSFRVAPSRDVGNDSLPRVSIEGSIAFPLAAGGAANPDDVDLYSIFLKSGETIILDVDHAYTPSTPLMTQLFVLDGTGAQLASDFFSSPNDGGLGSTTFFDPYLTYTNTGADATFYVAVSSIPRAPGTTPGEFEGTGLSSGNYVVNVSIDNPASDLGAFVVNPADLMANDVDADGDAFEIVSVGNPVNGTVELAANGEILFRFATDAPAASFEYTVSDGKDGETTAMVTLNGNPVVGTESDDVLVTTPEPDLMVGNSGADTFRFSPGTGVDTVADFTVGEDVFELTDGMQVANIQTMGNDSLVSFDTGDSALVVGVPGVTETQLIG